MGRARDIDPVTCSSNSPTSSWSSVWATATDLRAGQITRTPGLVSLLASSVYYLLTLLAVIFLVFMTGLLFANSLQSGLLPPAASKKVDFGPTEFVDSRQPVDSILTALEPKFSNPDQRTEKNQ